MSGFPEKSGNLAALGLWQGQPGLRVAQPVLEKSQPVTGPTGLLFHFSYILAPVSLGSKAVLSNAVATSHMWLLSTGNEAN